MARSILKPALLVSSVMGEHAPGELNGGYGQVSFGAGCLRVWQRDWLGNVSDQAELCQSDVTRIETSGILGGPDEPNAIGPNALDVEASAAVTESGCALAPQNAAARATGASLGSALLFALAALRRHGRAR